MAGEARSWWEKAKGVVSPEAYRRWLQSVPATGPRDALMNSTIPGVVQHNIRVKDAAAAEKTRQAEEKMDRYISSGELADDIHG